MDERPKSVFILVFLLLGGVAVSMPISPRFFGSVQMPSAELLDFFKDAPEVSAVSSPPPVPSPAIIAEAAIIYDSIHDTVIYEKKSNQKFGIASITKIMTALVAHDRVGAEERISISQNAVQTEGVEGDLMIGEHFALRDLVTIMLLSSSNDAAVALAEHIGMLYGASTFEESQFLFTRMMNEYARELGLSGTLFQNATGLDLDEDAGIVSNTSTARDLALLMKYTVQNSLLEGIFSLSRTTVYSEEDIPHSVSTTNELLTVTPGMLGGKTGFTDVAGGALVTVTEVPFGELSIIVVLGSTRDGRFSDTAALLEWLRSK